MKRLLGLLLLIPALAVAQGGSTGTGTSHSTGTGAADTCGYLPYACARQDLNTLQEVPLGLQLNSNGGAGVVWPAGTVVQDPVFGEPTLRVTDVNSIPGAGCFNSTSGNIAMVGPDNPDIGIFSSDQQWFKVADLYGNYWLYAFNPATMTATCAPVNATVSAQHTMPPTSIEPVFGHTAANAGIVFMAPLPSSQPYKIETWNVANYASSANVPVLYKDISTCTGLSWLTSVPIKSMQWFPGFFISLDDNRIDWAFGPVQNEGWFTAVYDKSIGDCGWVDTRTGEIGGNTAIVGSATQMTGMFPVDWGGTRPPTVASITQTTSGSGTLISGHTYDGCYSVSAESVQAGVGESSCSAVQRITLTGGNNALALPSPTQCTGAPNCDLMTWNYWNFYANDEANCGNAQCPSSSLYLQPAGNMGCSQSVPTLSVTPSVSGSTTFTYAVEVWGPHCMTYGTKTLTTGTPLSGSNTNNLSSTSVSGATWYRFSEGGQGNSSEWSSTVYGSASVDAAQPSGGGTVLLPAMFSESGGGTTATDQGNAGLGLDAVGTIPCYDNMDSGPSWGNLYTVTSGSALWSCNNSKTLAALTTGSGPTAPTKSTLGLFQHADLASKDDKVIKWGQEWNNGSDVNWILGSSAAVMCNVDGSVEYPASGYTNCPGHGVMGTQGVTYAVGGSAPLGVDANWETDYHTYPSFPLPNPAVQLFGITKWPAADPNGTDYYDQHQAWQGLNSGVDALTPYLFSSDTASGANNSTFQYATYIGRGLAREVDVMNPNGTFSRFVHHGASGVPYYSTTPCSTFVLGCFIYGWEVQAAISGDARWSLYTSDQDSSLGCDPTQTYPITGVTAGNPTTMTISIPSGNKTPLANQVGTVYGTTGVTGLNGQWTITGTSPNFTLSGSNLTGTASLTGANFAECTFNANGQVNGPAPASNCGSGSQTCATGESLRSVFVTQLH